MGLGLIRMKHDITPMTANGAWNNATDGTWIRTMDSGKDGNTLMTGGDHTM